MWSEIPGHKLSYHIKRLSLFIVIVKSRREVWASNLFYKKIMSIFSACVGKKLEVDEEVNDKFKFWYWLIYFLIMKLIR